MTTLDDWARLADEIKTRAEIFIGGDFRSAASGATFDSVNPATGDLIAAVSSADAVDVDAAVASARAAFEAGSWSQTSAGHRKRCCDVLPDSSTTTARNWRCWTRWTWASSPRRRPTSRYPRRPIFSSSTAKPSTNGVARSHPPSPEISPWSPASRSASSAPSRHGTFRWTSPSGRWPRHWLPATALCSNPLSRPHSHRSDWQNWRPRPVCPTHRVAAALRAGTVSVNTVDALSLQTPFGGFKQSGFGRDLSLHALDKYTGLKTTWLAF